MHPFNRRLLAEDLVRVRRADDQARYAAAQRQARIDPNPHQIDAVMFALRRLGEGGCILADEVGLGKTIEAGLVIAQRLAEGAQRVLLIVPKALIGQWQNEMYNLFAIQLREEQASFAARGVYIVGREFAGGARGSVALLAAPPFDLVVIDEAHEMFAAVHKRFGRDGTYDESSDESLTAHRVRQFLRVSPVLLLTATPIQNSLVELWGLVQYVEPTGTLLGDIATFRKVFCADDDTQLLPGQEHELQRRLAMVCQRTLRRQAQEFLDRPFMQRRCRLYEYPMSDEERSLYDDVTEYLLQPSLYAFAGRQRRLLLIGFHRRMASSLAALAKSLDGVVARLVALEQGSDVDASVDVDLRDLEDDDELDRPVDPIPRPADGTGLRAERELVESFVTRARALPTDAKARTFLDAIRVVLRAGADGLGSGKAVVFTESITTQEYLRRLLLDEGLRDDEVSLFRGDNDHDRARQALARWQVEESGQLAAGQRPSREVALRLGLVHEFRTRSKVMICTEAGAKGLNLQFCETVINYDLPWNPQRIEQRIGRCHRYSQQHDVTVVNFLAKDNEAHKLTFDILSRKLELFGKVLDASDTVLHEPTHEPSSDVVSVVSVELESDLRDIYDRSRTIGEVTAQLAALRDRVQERRIAFEREYKRTSRLIESRLNEEVQAVFRGIREGLPIELARFDHDVAALVESHLEGRLRFTKEERDGRIVFSLDEALPDDLGGGVRLSTGDARGLGDVQPLNLTHPLVRDAIRSARAWQGGAVCLASADAALIGKSGALSVSLVDYQGFEPVQRLVAAAIVDGQPADPMVAATLAALPASDGDAAAQADAQLLSDVSDEAVFLDQREVERTEQRHFEAALGQLERFVEDRILVAKRERASVAEKVRALGERRDGVVGSEVRKRIEEDLARLVLREESLGRRIEALETRVDADYAKWKKQYQELRYQAPTAKRLFQVSFRVVPAGERAC